MRDVRESDDDDETEKSRRVRQLYNECVKEVDGELPSYEDIERSIKTRPDKNYRAFKRNHSGSWAERLDTEQFVKQVYKFVNEGY